MVVKSISAVDGLKTIGPRCVDRLEGRKEVQRSGSALPSLLLKLLGTCGHRNRDPFFYEIGTQ